MNITSPTDSVPGLREAGGGQREEGGRVASEPEKQ